MCGFCNYHQNIFNIIHVLRIIIQDAITFHNLSCLYRLLVAVGIMGIEVVNKYIITFENIY